jgi:hypothetical protein
MEWVENLSAWLNGDPTASNWSSLAVAGWHINNIDSWQTSPSDLRLKENVIPILESRAYSHLDLEEHEWEWNPLATSLYNLKGATQGVLAEEVEKVMPGAVLEDKHGYKQVAYAFLDPYCQFEPPDPLKIAEMRKVRRREGEKLKKQLEDFLKNWNKKVGHPDAFASKMGPTGPISNLRKK